LTGITFSIQNLTLHNTKYLLQAEILFMNDGFLIEQNSTEAFFSHPKHPLTESYISEYHFI